MTVVTIVTIVTPTLGNRDEDSAGGGVMMHATLLFDCLQSDTRPAADTEMMMVITMITRHFLALLQTPSYLSCTDGLPLCKICKI